MNTSRPTLFVRCTLWMGALFAATAALAGPTEDLQQAEASYLAHDLPTTMTLLRRAASQDYPPAQARLGDMLRLAGDEAEAVEFYKKAAAKGDPAGEVGLGRAYADGAGVAKDPAKALELYRKAEQKNYGPALDMLARAYRTGTLGLPKDPVLAKSYEDKAAAQAKKTVAEGAK
ncbi:MAG TPA: tetratricopeptide repeat protein [Ramlibacter sp.]